MKKAPCKHPPKRLFAGFAYDPIQRKDTLWVGCCECGEVILGGAERSESMLALDRLMTAYKVQSYRSLPDGLVAIYKRKIGQWLYFRFDGKEFTQTGSTERLQK